MVRLLVICGVFLVATITVGTALILSNLREHAITDRERELQNIALVLAEQTDRAFQALDLVQASLIERMQALGIASSEDYQRQMSGHDVHLVLKEKIGSLPHVNALTVINAQGKVINFSRSWPIPEIDASNGHYFKALRSDPQLTSFISDPVPNLGTGTWAIYLARKFVSPKGEFLGIVFGAVDLQYFENFFGTLFLATKARSHCFAATGCCWYATRTAAPGDVPMPGTTYSRNSCGMQIAA
jgi:hypothetical protein